MFYVKEHSRDGGSVLAACDREVLGKTIKDGEVSLTVSAGFYGGSLASREELLSRLSGASNVNLVGSRAVALAIEANLVDEASIIKVGGVPHAIILGI